MNSNLPPIRKTGPGPIAPKPKNIKIQAGRVVRIDDSEIKSDFYSPPLLPPPPPPPTLPPPLIISNSYQSKLDKLHVSKNVTSNDISDTNNSPVFHAKLIKSRDTNNNIYENSSNILNMDKSNENKNVNNRQSSMDLPLPPSPTTLLNVSTYEIDEQQEPQQQEKERSDDKTRFKFTYSSVHNDTNNSPMHANVANNKNTTINVSSDSSNSPTITITTRNSNSSLKNASNYENNEPVTYNIPIQHIPSSKPSGLSNNKNLSDPNLSNLNDILTLSNRSPDNSKLKKIKNQDEELDNKSADDQVDVLKELLMKNLLGSENPDFAGICAKCGDSILGEVVLKAMDQTFHAKCFNCTICNFSIKDKHFYVMDSKPYCEGCYMRLLERCSVCSRPITDRILRATGKPFHPECFCCTVCKSSLDGVPFTVDATNKIHCIDCFHNKYAPRCHMCRLAITPEPGQEETTRIVALDKSFHIDCYKCEDCGVSLSSNSDKVGGCYPLDDHIFCRNCHIQRIRNLKGIATHSSSPIVTARSTDL